jgi:hypothetical protein
MRKLDIFIANTYFLLHFILGLFMLFGWLFPQIKLIYLSTLLIWISCWIFLGYCPPTKWEFSLRNKYDKNINPKDEFIKYYMYKLFKINIPSKNIFTGGLIVFIFLTFLSFIY